MKFTDDASLIENIDPRVKTMYAIQRSADLDLEISKLVRSGKRKDAIELVNEEIQLLKSVEELDDERGVIALLLRMAENMHNKIKDENVNDEIIHQGYSHRGYMQRQYSCEQMAMYD